ncbi:MAG: 4a-hydroxytetrahydrobiopterin dehydratase [Bacteroidota bacterium]
MDKLNANEIEQALSGLPNWEYHENAIHTSLEFENFKDCFAMMTRIAFEVEKMNHHPNWYNVYNTLTISLSTHDADGVTQKDIDLAKAIEQLITA